MIHIDPNTNAATRARASFPPAASKPAAAAPAAPLGIGANIKPLPAVALGAFEATPLQMATAYNVLANGGLKIEPFVAPVDGRQALVFGPRSEPENTPVAPVDGLQKAMRETEAGLAERLSAEVDVVVLDGPLSFLTAAARGRVVGFVKRLLRNYLDPAAHALLARLEVGERTPVFLIEGRVPRYSWYVRIARGRPIETPLTGVARLEAPKQNRQTAPYGQCFVL